MGLSAELNPDCGRYKNAAKAERNPFMLRAEWVFCFLAAGLKR